MLRLVGGRAQAVLPKARPILIPSQVHGARQVSPQLFLASRAFRSAARRAFPESASGKGPRPNPYGGAPDFDPRIKLFLKQRAWLSKHKIIRVFVYSGVAVGVVTGRCACRLGSSLVRPTNALNCAQHRHLHSGPALLRCNDLFGSPYRPSAGQPNRHVAGARRPQEPSCTFRKALGLATADCSCADSRSRDSCSTMRKTRSSARWNRDPRSSSSAVAGAWVHP